MTWAGENVENPSEIVRLDKTIKGLHAMVLSPEEAVFIDPYHRNTIDEYISYYKKDFVTHKTYSCVVENALPVDHSAALKGGGNASVGDELRTYRLAVSATGEYTNYHDGTVIGAMSAIVTTMNRVNGIYIRDFSVNMELIPNNDLVIYTDPATDPFGQGSDLVNNHNNLNMVIGSDNYDIGHVFDFGGGGVASLASVCNNNRKGRGYTSGNPPEADPFDIDYVAHEMGHQFAGNHTFNYCQGSQGPVPTEPGSATTIMGYAGICGGDNIQSNSNDHFHGVNFDETYEFTVNGNGNNCAVITATGNTPPIADAGQDGYFIPVLTPFEVEGSAVDIDGDSLTFCWENMDMGPASPPNSPSGATAIFRSFAPSNSPVRVFPQISDVINNSQTQGEILPAYSRPINLRMTVRDNFIGGGGVHSDDYSIEATDEAGPFLVTEPNTNVVWEAGSCQTIEWDVANTDQMPVNSQSMDIFLSVDGGFTYPYQLASGVPNSGSAIVSVPDTLGTMNRIKVKAADNVFFDISNENFEIVAATGPGFDLIQLPSSVEICSPDEAEFELYLCQFGGFSEVVNLSVSGAPTGTLVSFSQDMVSLPATITLTISNTAAASSGQYILDITAQSTSLSQMTQVELIVVSGAPTTVNLIAPPDQAMDVSRVVTLDWNMAPDATIYALQISEVSDFSTVLYESTNLNGTEFEPPSGLLQGNTTYYWRIRPSNNSCGEGLWSAPYEFTTEQVFCIQYMSTEVPRIILEDGTPQAISRIPIFDNFTIEDINVIGLEGTHSRFEDLEFILLAPSLDEIELIPQICNGAINFSLNLDDEAAGQLACPVDNGANYQPSGELSMLNNQTSTGFWTLMINDLADGEGGVLEAWGLELCQSDLVPIENLLNEGESINIFPNPTNGEISIKVISEQSRELELVITDVLGRVLFSKKQIQIHSGDNETFRYHISELVNGVYLAKITDASGAILHTEKISVMN